jgi:hypothetical protein
VNAEERRLLPAVAAILVLAAVLRFTGISWGLRHHPDWDEYAFVEGVAGMIRQRDLDQRFYEYPGLFFFVLYPFLWLLSPEALGSPRAYLVSRAVVAGFGVLSVWLAYRLAASLVTPQAGIVAALLLAVSPIDVSTAHMVRPDVVLGALALLALMSFIRPDPETRADAVAGAALGAAASVKVTGALLLPSLLLARGPVSANRWRGLLVAGVSAIVVWVLTTPSLFFRLPDLVEGVRTQWDYHYQVSATDARFGQRPFYYFWTIVRTLGPLGAALAAIGVWRARRRLRDWGAVIALPLTMLIVLSTAEVRWVRLLVPAMGAAAVAAAIGFDAFWQRSRAAAWALALGAALIPLVDSVGYVREVRRPGTRDRAVDWAEAHVALGGRILATRSDLGFDRRRIEVLFTSGNEDHDRLLARNVDAIVGPAESIDVLPDVVPVYVARSADPEIAGPPIGVLPVPDRFRDRYRTLPIERAVLSASSGAASLPLATDGSLETHWKTDERGGGEEWLEIELPEAATVSRIELSLGRRPTRAGRRVRVLLSEDGRQWTDARAAQGRPEPAAQIGAEDEKASQLLLFQPTRAKRIRVSAWSPPRQRWGFAEIRIDAPEPPGEQ